MGISPQKGRKNEILDPKIVAPLVLIGQIEQTVKNPLPENYDTRFLNVT